MKKGWLVILCLALVCGFSVMPLSAIEDSGTTEITTEVPDSHVITIESTNAQVFVAGEMVDQLVAKRLSTPTVLIRATSGYRIDKVMLGKKDITKAVMGGYYTFAPVYEDQLLKITTVKTVPDTTALYTLRAKVTKNGVATAGITVELRSVLQSQVTDHQGMITFNQVEAGFHSLTALENNKVIGYVELELNQVAGIKEIIIDQENGEYLVQVNPKYDCLDLTFDITDDGLVVIKDGHAYKQTTNGQKTGDDMTIMYLSLGLCIAVVGIIKLMKSKEQLN